MKKSFFAQLAARFGSETPVFFKTILTFGITLGGIGAAILGVKELPGVHLPALLEAMAGYMITAGAIAAAVAKSATTDPTLQAQGGSNVVVNDKHDGESTPVAKAPPIK